MHSESCAHFVFVDFENVPKVDLEVVKGKAVHVTLLIGNKQTKLDTALSLQLHEYAGQVAPLRVEASGRNALDMVLACYLGEAVERHPGALFTVVSKDKDFAPVLAHLLARGIKVERRDSFAAVFTATPKKPATATKLVAPSKPKSDTVKFDKFVRHLRNSPPSNKTKLEHMIEAYFKPALPVGGKKGIIAELMNRRVIEIDSAGKVNVPKI